VWANTPALLNKLRHETIANVGAVFLKDRRSRALRFLLGWILLEVIAAAQVVQADGATVLHSWIRFAVSPVVWSARKVSVFSEDFTVGLRASKSMMVELRQLRHENQSIAAENMMLLQDVETLSSAHELLMTLPQISGQVVLARCSFRHLGQGRMRARLSDHRRVARRSAAISGDGLVGRVVSHSRKECWIQLITHGASAVAVENQDHSVQGLAVGLGANRMAVEYIPKGAKLVRGEVLISSGADGVFPAGLPVVHVKSLRETDAAFLEVEAVSCVDLAQIRVVLLMPEWTSGPGI